MISSGATNCSVRPYRSRSSCRERRSMTFTNSTVRDPSALFQARQSAHGDCDQIPGHLLAQDVSLVFLGELQILIEAEVLGETDGLRRQQFLSRPMHAERHG